MVKPKALNLIPKELLKEPALRQLKAIYSKNRFWCSLGFILLVFVAIGAFQVLEVRRYSRNFAMAKGRLQEAKHKLNQLQSQALQIEKVKSELAKEEFIRKQRLNFLLSSSSEDKRYSKALTVIAEILPEDLWINQFVLGEDEIQIIGVSLDNQRISQFINSLDASRVFKNSRFSSSEKEMIDSHPVYTFQITTVPIWDGGNG